MLDKIINIVKKSRFATEVYKSVSNNLLTTNIPEITPLLPRQSLSEEKRINLLVPSINQEHLFGGISTALNFFDLLAQQFPNAQKRIILTDARPNEEDLLRFPSYSFVPMTDEVNDNAQIVSVNDRYGKTIPISKNDIFIATSWWTAHFAQQFVKWQAEVFSQQIKKMVYFIQDYEPGFYQWSSQYLLAESTYKYQGPQIAVFNTSLLHEYFKKRGYKFSEEYSFEPKLNKTLKEHLDNNTHRKIKQILIYGRPSVARNAFTLIIESLRIWAVTYPNAGEWSVISVGEQHQDIQLGNGVTVHSRGKLSLEEYASVLNESSVGLSLMVSPHPSYPPLEMAHFGMRVLTNSFENKDLSMWHKNIKSINECSPYSVAAALSELCDEKETSNNNVSNRKDYLDDSLTFNFIDKLKIV